MNLFDSQGAGRFKSEHGLLRSVDIVYVMHKINSKDSTCSVCVEK